MSGNNINSLERFVTAQEPDYETALSEIKSGRKRSHWMWYIFPQIEGLGKSEMSKRYGITDLTEATLYLGHPILGPRLVAISEALLELPEKSATAVMGVPDDIKLHSSMTLFASVPEADPVFSAVLKKFFDGQRDEATLRLL